MAVTAALPDDEALRERVDRGLAAAEVARHPGRVTRQVLTPKPYYGRWFRWFLAGYAAIALVSVVFFLPRAPWQAVVYLAVATSGVVGMVRDRFVAWDDVAGLADGGRLTLWLLSDDDTEVVVRAYRRSRRDSG